MPPPFCHIELSSQISAMRDHEHLGVVEYVVSGVVKSLARTFVSRICVTLACGDSSSSSSDKDVCVPDGFQIVLVVFSSIRNEVKVVNKHSWYRSFFQNLNYPKSYHQGGASHREKASLWYSASACVWNEALSWERQQLSQSCRLVV